MNTEDYDYGRADQHGINVARGNRHKWVNPKGTIEDLPSRDSNRKGRVGWSRHGGLGFPALDNMLAKGVGRPWDNVYSEIIAKIKEEFGSHCWADLINRIRWHVELNPMEVGNGQYVQGSGRPFYSFNRRSLMVHPKTGILMHPKQGWCDLRFTKPGERRGWWGEETHYWEGLYFRKMHGVWHEVDLAHVPKRPESDALKDYTSSGGRYRYYRPRDEDWLYKMDIRDEVLHTRLYSDVMHDLARCHGYKKFDGSIISHKQYEEEISKALKSSWYTGCVGRPLLCERYVYAKAAWPIGKARMRQVGIQVGPILKAPNIVR